MLAFHLKGKTSSGGNQWKAALPRLMDRVRSINQQLPGQLTSCATSEPVLLLHGESGTCIDRRLHKARDGTPNTLTLIKLNTGSICGAFSPNAWTSQSPLRACPSALVFLIAPNGAFQQLPFKHSGGSILGGAYSEPTHGVHEELHVKDHVLTARMRPHSLYGERQGCAFINELWATGNAHSAIDHYAVYHVR
ncbi:hypothetical protein BJ741DRAFT_342088 [Chytriomyces cf. hyalinus JEL632]|nr:hypothetical protein BJ741DRAFT_342088 [Chytriomyces cf. hyalinus JEL632]